MPDMLEESAFDIGHRIGIKTVLLLIEDLMTHEDTDETLIKKITEQLDEWDY